ncbi:arginase deacetylase [Phaffia rhodozyma]|uniref:Arginase deacetylase n=1 Tax=Phaffia rhodozyma TaxID=264483 RepID=A0A0F7SKD8_PHARH|nr:arginase deacetylase [Phaffia rhodozyma]
MPSRGVVGLFLLDGPSYTRALVAPAAVWKKQWVVPSGLPQESKYKVLKWVKVDSKQDFSEESDSSPENGLSNVENDKPTLELPPAPALRSHVSFAVDPKTEVGAEAEDIEMFSADTNANSAPILTSTIVSASAEVVSSADTPASVSASASVSTQAPVALSSDLRDATKPSVLDGLNHHGSDVAQIVESELSGMVVDGIEEGGDGKGEGAHAIAQDESLESSDVASAPLAGETAAARMPVATTAASALESAPIPPTTSPSATLTAIESTTDSTAVPLKPSSSPTDTALPPALPLSLPIASGSPSALRLSLPTEPDSSSALPSPLPPSTQALTSSDLSTPLQLTEASSSVSTPISRANLAEPSNPAPKPDTATVLPGTGAMDITAAGTGEDPVGEGARIGGASGTLASEQFNPWLEKFGSAGDLSFTGVPSFAHLPHIRCLEEASTDFDVAVFGLPFDSAVSFRPGARFGPFGIRSGSRRQLPARGWNVALGTNPYQSGAKILDCGDAPITPYDPALAIEQIEAAYTSLLHHPTHSTYFPQLGEKSKKTHPRIVSLGGDHTIVLPILRSLHSVWGPITVIHFDAHIDTWNPVRYPGSLTAQSQINHGTFFWKAYEEGLLRGNSSIHAGVRTRLTSLADYEDDLTAGFELIHTFDIDRFGVDHIIKTIRDRVGTTNPVYLSFDIDVIDPSMAPATGTPESGGWTTREIRRIIHGLKGLNFVGFDLVEVSPAYDTNAELTNIAAADLIFDFLSIMTLGQEELDLARQGHGQVLASEQELEEGQGVVDFETEQYKLFPDEISL